MALIRNASTQQFRSPTTLTLIKEIMADEPDAPFWDSHMSSYGVPVQYLFRYEKLANLISKTIVVEPEMKSAVKEVQDLSLELHAADYARAALLDMAATLFRGQITDEEIRELQNLDETLDSAYVKLFYKYQVNENEVQEKMKNLRMI